MSDARLPAVDFSAKDLQDIASRGISLKKIEWQIETFRRGIAPVVLLRACTPGDGIMQMAASGHQEYLTRFRQAAANGRVSKFVPASGAATRMFKSLLEIRQQLQDQSSSSTGGHYGDLQRLIMYLPEFAFFEELQAALQRQGHALGEINTAEDRLALLNCLLGNSGLDYTRMPKGLIPFHRYPDGYRTAFEEHLYEAARLMTDRRGDCAIHFTVAPQHLAAIRRSIEATCDRLQAQDIRINIQFSFQSGATDTLAVDLDNRPFRGPDGGMLFRPGGHGALLQNLDEDGGDIVFIKNIDNIVPDHLKDSNIHYKSLLGGYLLMLQEVVFGFLNKADAGSLTPADTADMLQFVAEKMQMQLPAEVKSADEAGRRAYLIGHLDRPLRVCGMVRNAGEPGGGPFWIHDSRGEAVKQIVESAQADLENAAQRRIWESSTHFNPVDLVCAVRDYRGRPFRLADYSDPDQGFISQKSFDGRPLKALELPGLWNGAMAFWNTVFIEVPPATFAPVKEVFDLLRPEHLPPA